MKTLVVVDHPEDWPIHVPDVEVVPARTYLADHAWHGQRVDMVFNLCRSYAYQSVGWYVSLLAEARGHRVRPGVRVMREFGRGVRLRGGERLDELVQRTLGRLRSDRFELSIYFGKPLAARHEALARALAEQFEAPLLRARFVRTPLPAGKKGKARWELEHIGPIAAKAVPDSHVPELLEAAQAWLARRPRSRNTSHPVRCTLAIVHDPEEPTPPSDERALKRFLKAAKACDVAAELLTPRDRGRLLEFDAVLLRATTAVDHWTYRWARDAERAGAVVIDDPDSILRCTNKVFLAELLERHHVGAPRSLVVHKDNRDQVVAAVGLPCVLKQPDGSFSQGVFKARDEDELAHHLDGLLHDSELVLAQEWLPTDFDWRIGLFDGRPLYAARYWMRSGHWQIVHRAGTGKTTSGRVEAVAVEDVPRNVMRAATKAAGLIGVGLYGVDVKQSGRRALVIEVNDNPNLDAGYEDKVPGQALYETIVDGMARRVEARRTARVRPRGGTRRRAAARGDGR